MKNERKIFVPQFPYNCKDDCLLKPVHTRTAQKFSSPARSQPVQTVPQSLFDKLNVSIIMTNPETTKVVEKAMISAGANVVVGTPEYADIVISESQISQPPKIAVTRGKKMVNAARDSMPRSQRNILLKQIPWVYDVQEPKTEPKSKPEIERISKNMIIVSDIQHRHRPMIAIFKKDVQLHFGDVPQGYPLTPFDPIPAMSKQHVEKYKAKLGTTQVTINPQPANDSYCYMCQASYGDAAMHQRSASHQHNAICGDWYEFDYIAEEINEIFLEGCQNTNEMYEEEEENE
ncbi:hypothetical protein TRFO_30909 [Tritrichomonas foetus]|uniref:DBF4-type domain-containing protein n=1 Tax=Tritrichomonas foetus TaxID=1144522 RepID=A0A1J4JUJ0_9EUKA|nr:hypothetical protein TRFO_30909 [Tritrichomonas foetus]|eukprot:OHT02144.1 hypothetical protein TRFO_30909 [Tritrichomonas foetus]